MAAFFSRLPPLDVRYRFFSAMRELSQEQMARLTQVDYDREMAFVAVREATGETVGVARLVREPSGRSGEFAVIVQPDMKGHGLASQLMQRLIDWARQRGMAEVVGQVLADNQPMLAFVRHLGFSLKRHAGGARRHRGAADPVIPCGGMVGSPLNSPTQRHPRECGDPGGMGPRIRGDDATSDRSIIRALGIACLAEAGEVAKGGRSCLF